MAFDVNKFKAGLSVPALRTLPVILLLDVSGSMGGEKIESLYDATVKMINSFVVQELREKVINVGIITFGASVDLHTKYTPVSELKAKGIARFKARGGTPLGIAISMAKAIIEDEDETPKKKAYTPVVVLVSDGKPTDEWRGPLDDFINSGRTKNCQRFSVAIGDDADIDVLRKFAQNSENVYYTSGAEQLAAVFNTISIKSTKAAKIAQSAAKPASVASVGGFSDGKASAADNSDGGGSIASWALDSDDDF